jgi:hypothetical protein
LHEYGVKEARYSQLGLALHFENRTTHVRSRGWVLKGSANFMKENWMHGVSRKGKTEKRGRRGENKRRRKREDRKSSHQNSGEMKIGQGTF